MIFDLFFTEVLWYVFYDDSTHDEVKIDNTFFIIKSKSTTTLIIKFILLKKSYKQNKQIVYKFIFIFGNIIMNSSEYLINIFDKIIIRISV